MLNKINFNNNSLPIIAGPCVIESKDHVFKMAENLKKIFFKLDVPFIFKSSFDAFERSESYFLIISSASSTSNISLSCTLEENFKSRAIKANNFK